MKRQLKLTIRQRETREILPYGFLWTLRYLTPDPRTGYMGRSGFESKAAAEAMQAELAQRGVTTEISQDKWPTW